MHITLCQLSRKEWAVATARGDAGFKVEVAARELNVELLEQACRNHMCIWFQCLHLSILQARAAFDMENTVRVKVDPYTTALPPPPPPGGFPLVLSIVSLCSQLCCRQGQAQEAKGR